MIGEIIDGVLERSTVALFASPVAPPATPEQTEIIVALDRFAQAVREMPVAAVLDAMLRSAGWNR